MNKKDIGARERVRLMFGLEKQSEQKPFFPHKKKKTSTYQQPYNKKEFENC